MEKEKPTAPARKLYSSWEWRKFAADFLRQHPVCEICGAPARVCDHKDIPADVMADAWGRFDYDPAHYQALCYSCNARKGAREDKAVRAAYQQDLAAISQHPEGRGEENQGAPSTAFVGNAPTHEEVLDV